MGKNKNSKDNMVPNKNELVKIQLKNFKCVLFATIYLFNQFAALKVMYFAEIVL
jgi:hypothetical protein